MNAAKKILYVYTVEGSGQFPVDMLRYDRATPHREDDSKKITDQRYGIFRDVTVQSNQKPTVARWKSFGWDVPAELIQEVRIA